MSEEEKKAIELLKQSIDKNSDLYISDLGDNTIRIVINLIEKQQKEIEDLEIKSKVVTAYHCDNLPTDVEMIILSKNDFERNINNDYISKDKIRNLIENNEQDIDYSVHDIIDDLRKLLEENKNE